MCQIRDCGPTLVPVLQLEKTESERQNNLPEVHKEVPHLSPSCSQEDPLHLAFTFPEILVGPGILGGSCVPWCVGACCSQSISGQLLTVPRPPHEGPAPSHQELELELELESPL